MVTLNALLNDLEEELKRLDYWCDVPPSARAMESREPFAIDTLNLTQWLQWIYLQRLRALLEANAELPTGALVKPYAEQYFAANRGPVGDLIRIIDRIDNHLGRPRKAVSDSRREQ